MGLKIIKRFFGILFGLTSVFFFIGIIAEALSIIMPTSGQRHVSFLSLLETAVFSALFGLFSYLCLKELIKQRFKSCTEGNIKPKRILIYARCILGIIFGLVAVVCLLVFVCFILLIFIRTKYFIPASTKVVMLSISLILTTILFMLSYLCFKDLIAYYLKKVPLGIHESGYYFAGFKTRFLAGLIDLLFYIPILAIPFQLRYSSGKFYLLTFVILDSISYIYVILLTGFRGQTIGKMIMNIKVFKLNGNKIGFRKAIYRSSVDILLFILLIIFKVIVLSHIPPSSFAGLSYHDTLKLLSNSLKLFHYSSIENFITYASLAWIFSEYVTLLFNSKRRAIHDFIAGTVVLDLKSKGRVTTVSA